MEEFLFKRDFKFVAWQATLLTNLYRSISAGVTLPILGLVTGVKFEAAWHPFVAPLVYPLLYFAFLMPVGMAAMLLARAGIPYIGMVNVVCSIMIVIGDPLLWLVDKLSRTGFVPVKGLRFLNFTTVLFVVDEERRAQSIASERGLS